MSAILKYSPHIALKIHHLYDISFGHHPLVTVFIWSYNFVLFWQ